MYEAWLEFPERGGGGGLRKNPFHRTGMDNFWNHTLIDKTLQKRKRFYGKIKNSHIFFIVISSDWFVWRVREIHPYVMAVMMKNIELENIVFVAELL